MNLGVVNTIFNSNTFLIYSEEQSGLWVIDPGSNTNELIEWIFKKNKSISGILITHAHFDHIFGLNDIIQKFPDCIVYASPFAIEGFESAKLNGSYYQEIPFVVDCRDYISINEGDLIKLWEDSTVKVIETPGHGIDCISFYVNGNLFTGDAFIPGVKVYTKFKKSNKATALHSINRLMEQFDADTMIWPGHEKNCLLGRLK
ncbi:MAG: MBL fold metallo-hydrolase [Paludibacter sp.]|nr:MBL fold metallo-hydrolase [Paludibacter sp.]